MDEKRIRFKYLLDENHIWPTVYHFKFIVLTEHVETIKELVGVDVILKPSKNGKYSSVSFDMKVSSSEEVMFIYDKVQAIEGIIPL